MAWASLVPPFDQKVRSFLDSVSRPASLIRVMGGFCCAGTILECGENSVKLTLLDFVPCHGFQECSKCPKVITVHIKDLHRRSLHLSLGCEIVCCGSPISPCSNDHWFFGDDTIVLPRPTLDEDLSFHFVHFFSGAFAGWEQGVKWCSDANFGFALGQQLSIDQDEITMAVWKEKHGSSPLIGPVVPQFCWNPSAFIGVQTSVADKTVLHLCANCSNIVATLSPPCPTWSRAGKGQGLSHSGGIAFLEALETCLVLQPNMLLMECVDDILHHADFPIITEYLKCAGFSRVYSDCVSHHMLSNHNRTRWLGVWVRSDHHPSHMPVKIVPLAAPRMPWTSQEYCFSVPPCWAEQLKLSASELDIYGKADLFPKAKRCRLGPNPQPCQVIEARFPSGSEPLPTLCASYSNQHMIQESHLIQKGLFAALEQHTRGISFFDPARFCSLFGAYDTIALPTKIQAAFKCVGNAITVQHAILPLLIGLQAALKQPIDIHKLLAASWKDRIMDHNAVIFQRGDFVFLAKIDQALSGFVSPREEFRVNGNLEITFSLQGFFKDRSIYADGSETLTQFLSHVLSGPTDLLRQLFLWDDDQRPNNRWTLDRFFSSQSNWSIRLKSRIVGELSMTRIHLTKQGTVTAFEGAISPTIPFSCVEEGLSVPSKPQLVFADDFESISVSKIFRCFIHALDNIPFEDSGAFECANIRCSETGIIISACVCASSSAHFLQLFSQAMNNQDGSFQILGDGFSTFHTGVRVDNTATTSCGHVSQPWTRPIQSPSEDAEAIEDPRVVESFLEHSCKVVQRVDNTATTLVGCPTSVIDSIGSTAVLLPSLGDRPPSLEGAPDVFQVDNTATTVVDEGTSSVVIGPERYRVPFGQQHKGDVDAPQQLCSARPGNRDACNHLLPMVSAGCDLPAHVMSTSSADNTATAEIRAGGHHGYQGFPMTLAAGASFEQRAAYAVDTHGWIASDEMAYYCHMIRWLDNDGKHFAGPMYWDVMQNDLEESPFGEFLVLDNTVTIVPILMQAHWCAVEVRRQGSQIHLTLHQVHPRFHLRLVRIFARRLDTTPARIQFDAPVDVYIPHLCGWMLIAKWIEEANVRANIPDMSLRVPVPPPDIQDLIALVISSSIESWRDAHADPAVALLAAALRRSFFYMLYGETLRGSPAAEHELLSAFPRHFIQPPDPPQRVTLASSSMPHVMEARINARLDHFQVNGGWMASDEMDHICEYAKTLNPEMLITSACLWCPVRNALVFPSQFPPQLRPYVHIIWPIIVGTHWIHVEMYRSHHFQQVNLIVVAPPAMQSQLNPLINHIIRAIGAHPAGTLITYYTQIVPHNLCGYAVAMEIFQRMGVTFPEVSQQIQDSLTASAW